MGANAQTTVPTFTAGDVLTAANMNISARTGVPVFADTTARDAAFGGTGEKVLAEGQLCYLESTNVTQQYDGSNWTTVGPLVAIFNETQSSGTNGGTFTSGSFAKRTLNTTVVNNIPNCSIASSVITLPVGTYWVMASSGGFKVDIHKARLQNTTAATTLATGSNGFSSNANDVMTYSTIDTVFTLSVSSTIELQSRCTTTVNTNGLGPASGIADEIYRSITIVKTA